MEDINESGFNYQHQIIFYKRMNEPRPEQSPDKKKEKKKHHHRDHSESKKKKKHSQDRSRSRSHKKKDKDNPKEKEKKHHKDRSRERDDRKDYDRDKKRQTDKPHKSRERERERERSHSKKRDRYEEERNRDARNKERLLEHNRERDKQSKYERWKREKDSGRFRFDSPPKSDESDMSDDPQKMDKLNKMKAEKQLVTSKADKKLYLGNLPPNITANQMMQMLNTALKKMEINCELEGDSIVSAWISPDGVGHYAFVQFRTAQEATAGLALNGASLYGYQLKLGRPKQYIEYHKQLLSQFGSDGNIDTILKKVKAMGGFEQLLKVEERLVSPPSRVLVLKNIVTIEQLGIDEEYNEIVQDVTDMAKRHGDLLQVVIPKPESIDLQQVHQRVKGLCYIFLKYKSVEQARYARKQFVKTMFSQKSVTCSYFPEKKFEAGDLDVIQRIILDF